MFLDLLIWFVTLAFVVEPEDWSRTTPPPQQTHNQQDEQVLEPIDSFGGTWKIPGFTRIAPLVQRDVNPSGRYPLKLDGKPMGVPYYPLEAIESLLGPWGPYDNTSYRYPIAIWLMADDAPGVFLLIGKGRVGVPVFLTTKPWPYQAGNADQMHRMPALRALSAKVTEVMATKGKTWP
jgi:hypothetical protein